MSTNKKGSTLIELLVGFMILGTIGVLLLSFLHRNPMSQKTHLQNTGREFTKRTLLLMTELKDSVYIYTDTLGVDWKTILKIEQDNEEICVKAYSIRHEKDTTRTLTYCTFP